MSETKEKNKSEQQSNRCPFLEEMEFISNKQMDADLKEMEEYMEDGFQSN